MNFANNDDRRITKMNKINVPEEDKEEEAGLELT